MKRSRFFLTWSVVGLMLSMCGIAFCSFDIPIKVYSIFNLKLNINRIVEMASIIFSSAFILCLFSLIYSIGLYKRKYEDISQIKKFALHELLFLINKQNSMLQANPNLDNPLELFYIYVINAYEIKISISKIHDQYENLLKRWEKESIDQLELHSTLLIGDIGLDEDEIQTCDPETFQAHFKKRAQSSPQSEKINVFIHTIKKDIDKYTESIRLCFDVLKAYIR